MGAGRQMSTPPSPSTSTSPPPIVAVDTFIFDLDGTLYPITNGYERACRERVFAFMRERVGGFASDAHARDVWWRAFQVYNQTLRSLRALGYDGFDAEEYWAYTRGDAREYLTPSAATKAFVDGLRGKKYGASVSTRELERFDAYMRARARARTRTHTKEY